MKFECEEIKKARVGSLKYIEEDYSFDTEPFDEDGITSFMLNDLRLEIDCNGLVLFIWGYCPLVNYYNTFDSPKNTEFKNLRVVLSEEPIPGISLSEKDKRNLPIYINKKKGWVCIGNPDEMGDKMIEFAPGSVATMKDNEIAALWLHPEKIPENL